MKQIILSVLASAIVTFVLTLAFVSPLNRNLAVESDKRSSDMLLLQQRVGRLESNVWDGLSNASDLSKIQNQALSALNDEQQKQKQVMKLMFDMETNLLQPDSRPESPTEYREGVPIAIYNGIVATARQEYPNDFSMQASYINEQVEAYHKLHP